MRAMRWPGAPAGLLARAAALWLAWGGAAVADMLPPGVHDASEGARYWVSRVELVYEGAGAAVDPAGLSQERFALGVAEDGYVGPRRGGRNVWFGLGELGAQQSVPVYASGLRELSEQLVEALCARGWVGAYVLPDPAQIEPGSGRDLRPSGRDALRLRVYTRR